MTTAPKILLVEDNDDHAELVLRSLEDAGPMPSVIRVRDGAAALDYLHRRGAFEDPAASQRPDLVLLDLRLPRVDGLRVLREIKATPPLRSVPVVVLSSSDDDRDLGEAYGCHANAYVVKPVEFARLSALMRDAGRFWLQWNERVQS